MQRETSLLWAWLPVALWTVVIGLESFLGSAANTQPLLETVLWRLFGDLPEATIDRLHFMARKTGHFLGYGVFAVLWFRAFAATFLKSARLASAALALACTVAVASLDEWRQSFSPDRTGHVGDVVLDGAGALVLLTVAIVAIRRPRAEPDCG